MAKVLSSLPFLLLTDSRVFAIPREEIDYTIHWFMTHLLLEIKDT